MHPGLLLIGGAALGALALKAISSSKAQAEKSEADRQKVLGMAATSFEAGKSYSCQLMVTNAIGTKDLVTATNVIKSTFEQLGFKMLSTPVPKGDENIKKFGAGEPSEWVFQGVWRRRDMSTIPTAPAWVGMLMAYKMPVSDDLSAVI